MYFYRIKDLRDDSEKTQKEVASYLGCSLVTYRNYEKGKWDIPAEKFVMLVSLYNIAIEYILGETDKKVNQCYSVCKWDFHRLKYLRRKHHYKQVDIATRLYCKENAYRRLELGEVKIYMNEIFQLAQIYSIPISEIFGLY